ncbi:hypothetical protein [Jannaschia formosa]|uniref:hypothetical protein n=1 Tax=Jannaschia formosa TaxID=2259592 RepID=UPI000E1BB518|nr:hypothetical protein [Jannaschia formosa]TFL18434.1 hypothetical protein DR046_10100 [Jannaschia formosa]
MTDPRLARLAQLAALRSLRSAARLAPARAQADALRGHVAALREAPRGEVADITQAMVQDSHDRWRAEEMRRLSMRLALAEAKAQPLREAHARDRAREAVLEKLQGRRR